MAVGKLVDTSKCLICNACTVECKRENEVVVGRNIAWTHMAQHEVGQFPKVKQYYIKVSCKHCTEAACVDVCPTKALYHHQDGMVVLDQSKCDGCGYCSQSCPFGVPQLDVTDKLTGAAKSNKCTFCVQQTANGGQPACASACPYGAIVYGDRDALLQQGKDRVEALKVRGIDNAQLYGENELGGLHVMYVLEDSPTAYSLPENPQYPGMVTLWQKITQPLGGALVGLAAVGLAANFIIARRNIRIGEREE